MIGVLRLSLMYLRFMPLARVVALLGLSIMAACLTVPALNNNALYGVGAMLLVLVPAMLGGAAMRTASCGSRLHVKPHGHRRTLLAALLATALLCAAHVLSVLIPMWLGWLAPQPNTEFILTTAGAIRYVVVVWSVIAAMWLLMFLVVDFQKTLLSLFVLGALLANAVGKRSTPDFSLPFATIPAFIALGWLVFSYWYLRRPRLRGLMQVAAEQWLGGNQRPKSTGRTLSIWDNGATGRNAALLAFLNGTPSMRSQLLSQGIPMVFLLLFALLQIRGNDAPDLMNPPMFFFGLFGITGWSLGFSTARRARFLWLKAGLDRTSLFRVTEIAVVQGTAIALVPAGALLLALSIWRQPDLIAAALLYIATFSLLGVCAMYQGLAFMRQRNVLDIALAIIFVAAWIALMIWLLPTFGHTTATIITLCAALPLAAVLRAHARARWHNIDWHLTRPVVLTGSRPART